EDDDDDDDNDFLFFGTFDDEHSFKSIPIEETSPVRTTKRQRATSSLCVVDDHWEIFPETNDTKRNLSTNHLIDYEKKDDVNIGMGNFRVKHRHREKHTTALNRWKSALHKMHLLKDPWEDFRIDRYPEETVTVHDFDPIKGLWNTHEIKIKIEAKPFTRGAMRECFRMKKLPFHSNAHDWDYASNYVGKRYIESVLPERYFDDVMLQMAAKLWGQHYNRHNPPKKVDIVQMSVLEFKQRPGQPYYHLERFIEGSYIKYNSNSGFVFDEDQSRHTPQVKIFSFIPLFELNLFI
ncbi:unnamed protein product, partial [Didymodactylos carnosus]